MVGTDLKRAIRCLESLGRVDEIDAFREAVVAVHQANWRLLQAAAETYLDTQRHEGFIVAGKFYRGQHQGGGQYVSSYDRDRARALQLLVYGMDRARKASDRGAAGLYFVTLARAILGNRGQFDSWRLQTLTPIDVLPDYEQLGFSVWGAGQANAPVEADGTPVYYRVPESFPKARNDGERWRWALAQAVEVDPGLLNTARSTLADFLVNQFGTQTIAGWGFGRESTEGRPESSGPYALDTLKDEETIARLATGIKRFTLPDEFNPIKIYQAIADDPKTGHGEASPGRPGDHLREPSPARPRRPVPEAKPGSLWRSVRQPEETAARPDPRRLGSIRSDDDPARRPGGFGQLPLP